MKKSEAREGMELKLDKPAVCRVSFSQGNEKTVLFAVYGVPQVRSAGPHIAALLFDSREYSA